MLVALHQTGTESAGFQKEKIFRIRTSRGRERAIVDPSWRKPSQTLSCYIYGLILRPKLLVLIQDLGLSPFQFGFPCPRLRP